jgi:LemA protein
MRTLHPQRESARDGNHHPGRPRGHRLFARRDVQPPRHFAQRVQHERETLENVIRARNTAVDGLKQAASNPADAAAVRKLSGADAQLDGLLGRLFATAEAYPDLKANQTMMQLSEELTSTENKVAFARQAYNDAVMSYDNSRETFPSNVVAGAFGFEPATALDIAKPEAREVPRVSFG